MHFIELRVLLFLPVAAGRGKGRVKCVLWMTASNIVDVLSIQPRQQEALCVHLALAATFVPLLSFVARSIPRLQSTLSFGTEHTDDCAHKRRERRQIEDRYPV